MGYMRHHAIIVTSWSDNHIQKARRKALDLHMLITPNIESNINGYQSFFIPPDGSKEGWEESDGGDKKRDQFVEWLNTQRTEDGGTYLKWAEVQYGDEEDNNLICRHSGEGEKHA